MGLLDALGAAPNGLLDVQKKSTGTRMAKLLLSAPDEMKAATPLNYEAALDLATNIPVAGDLLSGALALRDAAKGEWGSAGMNALGVLPFVPSMGGVIKQTGSLKKHALWPDQFANDVKKGLGVLPESKTWDAAGNVIEDMQASVRPLQSGGYIVAGRPMWGAKNKPFYAVGDDPEELAAYAIDRFKKSDRAIKAADNNTLLGRLKSQFGEEAFQLGKSTQSKSQYITHTPSGTKIRISDHDLPMHYEQPDVDLRLSMSKDDQLSAILKALTNE